MTKEVAISIDPPKPEVVSLSGNGMQFDAHAAQEATAHQKTHPIRDALEDTGSMDSGRTEQKRI